MSDLSAAQARRVALAAQGFADPRPTGRIDVRHVRRVVDRVKLLQIDSVNVLVRAHYVPLFSRLGPYPMSLLDRAAYRRRELVEFNGRMASFVPMDTWPLFRTRMERPHPRYAAWADANADYIEWVYAQLRDRGPMSAGDFEDERERRGPWWDWSQAKASLEWLFRRGRAAIARRVNFERHYDVVERVVPPEVLARRLSEEEALRRLVSHAARAIGVGTAKDVAGYFGVGVKTARPQIAELVDEGVLIPVRVEGWRQPAYLHADAKTSRTEDVAALLTPFDTLTWERDRIERLFDFRYRIEIYVPKSKRIYGYYVLPFLMGDRLVARVDLKSDRASSSLLVHGAFVESGADERAVADRLGAELHAMAHWLELEHVKVGRRGALSNSLRKVVN